MNTEPLVALYALAVIYSIGVLLTLILYFYVSLSYRRQLAAIGWKPPLQRQDYMTIALDVVLIFFAGWPLILCSILKQMRK